MAASNSAPLLALDDVEAVYGGSILALRGVSLRVPESGIVALLGANGAGKTTVLRAISGLLSWHRGRITRGRIAYDGADITGLGGALLVRRGIAQVMEGRRIFGELTVEENLRMGAFTRHDGGETRRTFEQVLEEFPILRERFAQPAGYLSGGQQQMLAIGRAMMARPRLLLLDEPSLGLAPIIVTQIREVIRRIAASGVSVMLVEQNADMALSLADYGYILESGRIALEGPGPALKEDPMIRELYLGIVGAREAEMSAASGEAPR
ncbi:ABC transporter ATP-binding protein [Xanthobacter sp. KR7-225]|uniref:ABC transporter ATP-binding protein n=1 Tax=Xanthobacter sp. KR7-225 TaxID=3156613 RepID=UPI0032B513BC